jgi:hypothetical protein
VALCVAWHGRLPIGEILEVEYAPTRLSFLRDIWSEGKKAMYANVLRRISMVQ